MCDFYEYAGMELIAITNSTTVSTITRQLTDNKFTFTPSQQAQTLRFPVNGEFVGLNNVSSIEIVPNPNHEVPIDMLAIDFVVPTRPPSTITAS